MVIKGNVGNNSVSNDTQNVSETERGRNSKEYEDEQNRSSDDSNRNSGDSSSSSSDDDGTDNENNITSNEEEDDDRNVKSSVVNATIKDKLKYIGENEKSLPEFKIKSNEIIRLQNELIGEFIPSFPDLLTFVQRNYKLNKNKSYKFIRERLNALLYNLSSNFVIENKRNQIDLMRLNKELDRMYNAVEHSKTSAQKSNQVSRNITLESKENMQFIKYLKKHINALLKISHYKGYVDLNDKFSINEGIKFISSNLTHLRALELELKKVRENIRIKEKQWDNTKNKFKATIDELNKKVKCKKSEKQEKHSKDDQKQLSSLPESGIVATSSSSPLTPISQDVCNSQDIILEKLKKSYELKLQTREIEWNEQLSNLQTTIKHNENLLYELEKYRKKVEELNDTVTKLNQKDAELNRLYGNLQEEKEQLLKNNSELVALLAKNVQVPITDIIIDPNPENKEQNLKSISNFPNFTDLIDGTSNNAPFDESGDINNLVPLSWDNNDIIPQMHNENDNNTMDKLEMVMNQSGIKIGEFSPNTSNSSEWLRIKELMSENEQLKKDMANSQAQIKQMFEEKRLFQDQMASLQSQLDVFTKIEGSMDVFEPDKIIEQLDLIQPVDANIIQTITDTPTTIQTITKLHDTVQKTTQKLNENSKEYSELQNELLETQDELNKSKLSLINLELQYNILNDSYNKLLKENNDDRNALDASLEEYDKKLNNFQQELKERDAQVLEKTEEINRLKEKIQHLKEYKDIIREFEDNIDKLQRELRNNNEIIKKQQNVYEERIKREHERFENIKREYNEIKIQYERERDELKELKNYLQNLETYLTDNKILLDDPIIKYIINVLQAIKSGEDIQNIPLPTLTNASSLSSISTVVPSPSTSSPLISLKHQNQKLIKRSAKVIKELKKNKRYKLSRLRLKKLRKKNSAAAVATTFKNDDETTTDNTSRNNKDDYDDDDNDDMDYVPPKSVSENNSNQSDVDEEKRERIKNMIDRTKNLIKNEMINKDMPSLVSSVESETVTVEHNLGKRKISKTQFDETYGLTKDKVIRKIKKKTVEQSVDTYRNPNQINEQQLSPSSSSSVISNLMDQIIQRASKPTDNVQDSDIELNLNDVAGYIPKTPKSQQSTY